MPLKTLSSREAEIIHEGSLKLLEKVGLDVRDEEARKLFLEAGAQEIELGGIRRISFSANLINDALQKVPKTIKLGARDPEKCLTINVQDPRTYTGGGSQASDVLEAKFGKNTVSFEKRPITNQDMIDAVKICEHLPNADFCGRWGELNLPLGQIDVNKAFISFNYTTKHIAIGPINDISRFDDLIKMAKIAAGGKKELAENPLFSFKLCPITDPLIMHAGGGQKLIKAVQEDIPTFVVPAPQGGSTSHVSEAGELIQVNAETLALICLAQLARPGAKVIYEALPLMTDFSTGNQIFCSVEAILRQGAALRMAQYYQIPSATLAGVADAALPGMEAVREKFHSYFSAPFSGAHLSHSSLGMLGGLRFLSFLQMVIDDELLGQIKAYFQGVKISREEAQEALGEMEEVIGQGQPSFFTTVSTRKFARESNRLYIPTLLFRKEMNFKNAQEVVTELLKKEVEPPPQEVNKKILRTIPGILPELNPYQEAG